MVERPISLDHQSQDLGIGKRKIISSASVVLSASVSGWFL